MCVSCTNDTKPHKPSDSIDASEKYGCILELFHDEAPQRIVSIAPSVTELLFEFGVGDRIVGAVKPHDYPPEAENLETVGNIAIDLERVILLNPDILIGEANLFAGINLDDLNIPVLLFDTRSVDDLIDNIEVLELLFRLDRGDDIIKSIKDTIASLEIPETRPRVALVISDIPLMLAAGNSYFSDLVTLAGGDCVISDINADYLTISQEDLLHFNPEIIICTYEDIKETLIEDYRFSMIDAMQNNRITYVDPDIVLRPTLRSIKTGAPMLNSILMPDRKNHPANEQGD